MTDPSAGRDQDSANAKVNFNAPEHHLGANVIAYLLSGPLTFGGIGMLLDWWLDTSFLVVCGLLIGMALAFYVIWLRYGKQ